MTRSPCFSRSPQSARDETRRSFEEAVLQGFQSLNPLRAAARNSLWLSLIMVFLGSIVNVAPFEYLDMDTEQMDDSLRAALVCLTFFLIVLSLYVVFESWDFLLYAQVSAAVGGLALAASFLASTDFPTTRVLAGLILTAGTLMVPSTVRRFRMTFLVIVKRYSPVF